MSEKRTKKTQLDNIRKGKNLLLEGIRTVGLVRNKKEEELEKVLDIRNRELLKKLFPSCGKYSPKKAEKKAEEEMENRKRRAAQILAKDAKKKKKFQHKRPRWKSKTPSFALKSIHRGSEKS